MMETVPRGTNARKRKRSKVPQFLKGRDSDGVFSRQTCSGGTSQASQKVSIGVKHLDSVKSVSGQKKKKGRKRKRIVNYLRTRRSGCDFLQRHVAEVLLMHRDSEDQSEGGHFVNEGTPKYPCTCKELARIVNVGNGGRVCTMCGLILESNMLNEYAHMRGSAEGNNPENGEKRSAAACNTSGIANHYFLRNAMVGTQDVQFINSKGKEVQVQLPEDDKDKCFKRITVALRDHVFLLKLSQRIFDMSISILEDLEREHFFQHVPIPHGDETKLSPLVLSLLYLACKITGYSRSLKEICKPFVPTEASPSMLNDWLKQVKSYLTIKIPLSKPIEYISRFCHLNSVKEHEERLAREICIAISRMSIDMQGCCLAQDVALATIFLALACIRSDLPLLNEMAGRVGVSLTAVERTYMILRRYSKVLLPDFALKLLHVKANTFGLAKAKIIIDERDELTENGSIHALPTF